MSQLPATGTEPAGRRTTVLPLGDSITAGGGGGGDDYRHRLAEKLDRAKLAVEFVGPHQDQRGLRHAGFSGQNSRQIRRRIDQLYRAHPADIVLMHVGHNHFADKRPVPGILADTRAIIETLHARNPRVRILLAQVIPSGKLPKYSYIPELNKQLAALAAQCQQDELPVVLVDQASEFDWRTDTVDDRVHPNPQGAEKIAECWFQALRPELPETNPVLQGGD